MGYTGDNLMQDLLNANGGSVFFAAAAMGVGLASQDPNDPLKQPYSVFAAATAAAKFFRIDDRVDELQQAIEMGLQDDLAHWTEKEG